MENGSTGNTRRTFLAAGALGAVAGLVPGGHVAGAGANQSAPQPVVSFDCSTVTVENWSGASAARARFRDGSFVDVGSGTPESIGSPGRVLESVTFSDTDGNETTYENDAADCDPGPKATTFTDSRATVRHGEFTDLEGAPDTLIARVVLHFADGTSQTKVNFEGPSSAVDVATAYHGSGEHEGKVVEAVEVFTDLHFTTHFVRNPAANKALLGKETCKERCIEVVGATSGAVDYEFTVDGAVRSVSLTDRRGANPDYNDGISDDGDGTWTVVGSTGNPGYSDVYAVNGQIQSFTQTGGPGDYVLRECEWRILEDTSDPADNLAVVTTESGECSYEFTVDGSVRRVPNAGDQRTAEGNDDVVENDDGTVTVSGFTGNAGYGDSYAISGNVESFARTGGDAAYRLEFNGREVTPDDLTGGS